MNKNTRIIIGFILMIIGLLGILSSLEAITIHLWDLWPFILLTAGIIFEGEYFFGKHKESALLIPGGIFITIAIIFIFCELFGWHLMRDLWPLFIIAPGIGLFQFYLFGERETALLIPTGILFAVGGSFIINNLFEISSFALLFSIGIILLGIIIITHKDPKQNNI